MNTLYPGLIGTFSSSFSLAHSLALFWPVHRSHMVPTFLLIQSSFILLLASANAHKYVQ